MKSKRTKETKGAYINLPHKFWKIKEEGTGMPKII